MENRKRKNHNSEKKKKKMRNFAPISMENFIQQSKNPNEKQTFPIQHLQLHFNRGKALYQELFKPELKKENKNLPGLSASAEIKVTQNYGRFLEASAPIKFNEKVAKSKAYVAVIDCTHLCYCLTCLGETTSSKIQVCGNCEWVRYCSPNCKKDNKTHEYECGTEFHCIKFGEKIMRKLVIQMVLKALALHEDDVTLLREKAEKYLNVDNEILPKKDKESESDFEFRCIMCLQASNYAGCSEDLNAGSNVK